MSEFGAALKLVGEAEGGYVNHPADRGGPTSRGVTQVTYNQYRAGAGLPSQDVRQITADEVEHIYQTRYWLAARCDVLPWPISGAVFDAAVNHGVQRAVMLLQKALSVKADGIVGPVTITAAEGADPDRLVEDVLWLRAAFYYRLSEDPTQLAFLRGWVRRLIQLRKGLGLA